MLHYKLNNYYHNLANNSITTWTNATLGQYYTNVYSVNIADFMAETGATNGDPFTFSIDLKASN